MSKFNTRTFFRYRMTKAEQVGLAWEKAYMRGDYSSIEELLHPDYLCFDHRMGMEVDFEAEKSLVKTVSQFLTLSTLKILYENDDVMVGLVFSKYKEAPPRFMASMITGHFKDGKLFRNEIVREVLDYDPAEIRDWNWEDYE